MLGPELLYSTLVEGIESTQDCKALRKGPVGLQWQTPSNFVSIASFAL